MFENLYPKTLSILYVEIQLRKIDIFSCQITIIKNQLFEKLISLLVEELMSFFKCDSLKNRTYYKKIDILHRPKSIASKIKKYRFLKKKKDYEKNKFFKVNYEKSICLFSRTFYKKKSISKNFMVENRLRIKN